MSLSILSNDQEIDAPEYYAGLWAKDFVSHDGSTPGSIEALEAWDKKAPSFARKLKRSGYIDQLIKLLDLNEDDTVFDMGCGSGTLSIPLALAGHEVIAVDFSEVMLEELKRNADIAEADDHKIQVFQRSWQQPWDDLPTADVIVSSRSFITNDLEDAISKMESHGSKEAVVTLGAGDLPYRDSRIDELLGRNPQIMYPRSLSLFVGYLFALGRLPRVEYITYVGSWHKKTYEELCDSLIKIHCPMTIQEMDMLKGYLDAHIIYDEVNDFYRLDYDRLDQWGCVLWKIPQ